MSDRDSKTVRQLIGEVWTRYGEKGRMLVDSVETLLSARSALAHSAIFMKIEVS